MRATELRDLAYFWKYWGITPSEYRTLTVAEHNAMIEVMKEEARRNRKAANRARR